MLVVLYLLMSVRYKDQQLTYILVSQLTSCLQQFCVSYQTVHCHKETLECRELHSEGPETKIDQFT